MHRLLRCLDIMYEVVGCRINAINLPVVETLSFQKYTIELYGGPSASLKLK
ncbi:unnamed protein product, partial [Ascophyllum nodosum]